MRVGIGCMVLAVVVVAGGAARANEFGGSYAWQFRTPSERAVAASIADMMERRRAGGYGPASLTNNNYFGPNVAGDYIACDVAATATGNIGTASVTGSSSSPSLVNQPIVSAATTGNTASGLQGGTRAAGAQNSTSQQSNWRSSLTAGVSGTSAALSSGTIDASGGVLNQTTTSTQTNRNSPQTASVVGSNACYFVGR